MTRSSMIRVLDLSRSLSYLDFLESNKGYSSHSSILKDTW